MALITGNTDQRDGWRSGTTRKNRDKPGETGTGQPAEDEMFEDLKMPTSAQAALFGRDCMVEKLSHAEIECNRLREENSRLKDDLNKRTGAFSDAFNLMAKKMHKLKKRCAALSAAAKDVRP